MYVDGVECSYDLTTNGTGSEDAHDGTWQIGARSADDSVNFDGDIWECYYFDKVLSQAEITLLASSKVKRIGLQISNVLAYFPMDDEPDGTSFDGDTVSNYAGSINGTGVDGGNDAGLTAVAESVLSYP